MAITETRRGPIDTDARDTPEAASAPEVVACLGQLVRTLKTCRLYDENNPTVVRFREALANELVALIARIGALRLEIGANAIACAGQDVHVARSRDDNLAGALHRDGIRTLSFEPGLEAREVDVFVDQLLRITGPCAGDDDLVTLLWDANLPHVVVETVPVDAEADEGLEDGTEDPRVVAWPRQGSGAAAALAEGGSPAPEGSRSDDWITGDDPADLEEAFDGLESVALSEIARFQHEQVVADSQSIVTMSLQLLEDCFAGDLIPSDRSDLAAFIPRVLREALAQGDWPAAGGALRRLRDCDPDWSVEEFACSLCGPLAITTRQAVFALDRQGPEGVQSFLALAREVGSGLAEWLMHLLAASQQKRVRRPLARAIGELLAAHPERVVPWLSDPRWYVVRNAVHILGWIGGDGLADHLRAVVEHSEERVRCEVVAALSQGHHAASRPILMAMLDSAEPELFGAILHQLSADGDDAIAEKLLALLQDQRFPQRSEDERRSLLLALASRGERILPALEAELFSIGLFARRSDPTRQAIALCIARIGTSAARDILDRGLCSRHGPVRKACQIAGASRSVDHE